MLLPFSSIRKERLCFYLSIVSFYSFQGHVEQWIDFSTFEIDNNLSVILRPRFGYAVYHPGVSWIYFLIAVLSCG